MIELGIPAKVVDLAKRTLGPRETLKAGLRGYHHVLNNLAIGFVTKYAVEIQALSPAEAERILPTDIYLEARKRGLVNDERN